LFCALLFGGALRAREWRFWLRALESCGAAPWVQLGPVEGGMLGHAVDMDLGAA
jgi:hypothetical protein